MKISTKTTLILIAIIAIITIAIVSWKRANEQPVQDNAPTRREEVKKPDKPKYTDDENCIRLPSGDCKG